MSGSFNRATLIGNLCRDPEVRSTQGGKEIANLTVATSEQWRDKNSGERREKSEFHRVSIFSEGLVKVARDYLRKGSKVLVEGQIQTRKWTDQSGIERYSTEIVLQGFNATLVMLDAKKEGSTGDSGYDKPYSREAAYQSNNDVDEDEIPFAIALALGLGGAGVMALQLISSLGSVVYA